MKKRIILFGGTFDPVHCGHLHIARLALKKLRAAKVIFIPARNPRWKDPSPAEDRYQMLKLALAGEEGFELSSYEMASSAEVNYSYETVCYFKKIYPQKEYELFFLIGADQIEQLPKWHQIDALAKAVHFLGVVRPGFSPKAANIAAYHVQLIEDRGEDISSSAIRELSSLQTTKPVIDYIVSHELYAIGLVRKYMSVHRWLHSVSVAELSYQIAQTNELDPAKAYLTGLLHDIGKDYYDAQVFASITKKYQRYFPHGIPKWAYHQFTGAYLAKKEFHIRDKDIIRAIRYHTTGKMRMTKLGKILYAADKIEPLRGFDSAKLIAAMKKDCNQGFIEVIKAQKAYLENNHGLEPALPDLLSASCMAYYLKGGK